MGNFLTTMNLNQVYQPPLAPQPVYAVAGQPVFQPAQPIPGLRIDYPAGAPLPGQVVVAYEVVEPQVGCCQCDDLSEAGLISLIVIALIFFPLMWIPCVMESCHNK